MGSRTMPVECEHGRTIDWGDFGPDPDDSSVGVDRCDECERPLIHAAVARAAAEGRLTRPERRPTSTYEVAGRRVNAPGRGPTRTNLEDNMQTIPVAHFGRYAIVTRQTDDPEWQIYHPTDDDFGKFWFVDPVDAYQHLAYIEERELSDWEASEGVDDDGYPLVQTLYKVWTFSSDSVTEHDVAHLASVTLPNVQELIGWALNALDAGDTEKAKALLRQAL